MRTGINSRLIRFGIAGFLVAIVFAGCSREARKTRFLNQADASWKAGQYDNAKIQYLNVLRLDGKNALAYERIGEMWLEEGAPLRAAPYFLKTRELDPNNLLNRVKLAEVYFALGKRAEAIQEATTVLQRDNGNGEAIRV